MGTRHLVNALPDHAQSVYSSCSHGSLQWLRFNLLEAVPGIIHGIFLRHGGTSTGPYESLNVGYSTGDHPVNVDANRTLIKDALGLPVLTAMSQVHGSEAAIIDTMMPERSMKADALITNTRRLGLMVQAADCQSILLVDPYSRAIANIHSGWRGSLQNIVGNTITKMVRNCGVAPYRMIAVVGPSLGPCCAEFREYNTMFPKDWQRYHVGNSRFDFWKITLDQLVESGLSPENIAVAGICTRCSSADFFSYRAEAKTGRFASIIALR